VSKYRRSQGWNGRMVVHTHCGEGFAIYYNTTPASNTFENVFGSFPVYSTPPNARTNPYAPRENIKLVVEAIQEVKNNISDIDCYIIFRLGHVTHIDPETAFLMGSLGIEADVNLDSNLVTGALPISIDITDLLANVLSDPIENFKLNNFTAVLIPDPTDVTRVSDVFKNSSLLTLLTSGVKVIMLGTDATGTEEDPLTREVVLLNSLLSYYNNTIPEFYQLGITYASVLQEATKHQNLVDGTDIVPGSLCYLDSTNGLSSPGLDMKIVVGISVGCALLVLIIGILIVLRMKKSENIDNETLTVPIMTDQ